MISLVRDPYISGVPRDENNHRKQSVAVTVAILITNTIRTYAVKLSLMISPKCSAPALYPICARSKCRTSISLLLWMVCRRGLWTLWLESETTQWRYDLVKASTSLEIPFHHNLYERLLCANSFDLCPTAPNCVAMWSSCLIFSSLLSMNTSRTGLIYRLSWTCHSTPRYFQLSFFNFVIPRKV